MRTALSILLVAAFVACWPSVLLAQQGEESRPEESAGRGEQDQDQEKDQDQGQAKGQDDDGEETPPAPPLPPVEGDAGLQPLPPIEGDDEQGGGLPPPPPGFREVSMDEAAAARPPLNLLDLHGYLRMRGDLNQKVHLGLRPRTDPERGASYPQFPRPATGRGGTLAMANMRFRLEPTINISEDIRIMAQVDMLDNLILGSTPDGFPQNQYYPLVAFSQGQIPPSYGFNALKDSVQVKRVWGEVMTPVGLLRFGRMGSQWGLGVLANDGGPAHHDRGPLVTNPDPFSPTGRCFDCDYGSTADRIMFITKIAGHYIVPMIDFTSEGPYFSWANETAGQPIDADQLDDVNSYILAVARNDKPEDIQAALERDEWVLNYGVYFVFRNQALDAIKYHTGTNAGNRTSFDGIDDYAVRNVEAYIPDVWVRFHWGKLRLELEAVGVFGKIGYTTVSPSLDSEGNLIQSMAEQEATLTQYGGVLQGDYTFMNNQLILGMEMGFASGDDSPGFGVRPFAEKQFSHAHGDHDINNFRFNLDYHVDLILWRQIIGTVTDAVYLKPSLQYNIAEGLGTKISAVYSSAVKRSSTRGKSAPLGIEFDVDFFYFSSDNFHAGVSYGILIPFSGMNDLGADGQPGGIADADKDKDADIAHRILGRVVLYF